MRCPDFNELPHPPPGKNGWPWTEKSEQLPKTMPDVSEWPKISIVTPSFNQGQFLAVIRPVILTEIFAQATGWERLKQNR